jgi:hypothetical protein
MFFPCLSTKARWLSVWVRTYLVVRVETEYLCCFFNCVRTPWSACVQTVVLIGTGFGRINSESLQIHYTCSCLGRHLLVQHPAIDHNCVNRAIENSKLPFSLDLILEISLNFCWAGGGGGGNVQRECKGHLSSGILHGTLCIWLRCKKVNNIPDILHLHLDNRILKCRKVLLTVSDQIFIFLCKWVSA